MVLTKLFSKHQCLVKTLSHGQHCSILMNSTRTLSSKIRRSLLYVPGHDQRKIDKITKLNADCVVLDCEDGVGYHQKKDARKTIVENYNKLQETYCHDVAVRINSLSSGLAEDDINAIMSMPSQPSTIVIPKVDETQDITQDIIDAGVKACDDTGSCTRISGMIFGSDDFCADLGICRSHDGNELMYARQKIVATAKAYKLQAVDMVYIDFKDPEGLKQQSLQGARFGFTGKQAIHPGQVDIIQSSFSPDQEKVEWAEELLKAYENCSQGVFVFRGQMIDMPTILQAENIRNMQSHINKIS